ncbi:MAG: T9SS type A sorting domain-containing protein [Bacteroidota bacterium]
MTWSTYFGGTGLEETVDARSEGQIIVNPNIPDQVYISGYTLITSSFPKAGSGKAFTYLPGDTTQTIKAPVPFIARFDHHDLNWTTFWGCDNFISTSGVIFPSFSNNILGISMDNVNRLYVVGFTDCDIPSLPGEYCDVPTDSTRFPICPQAGFFLQENMFGAPVLRGETDAFIASFNQGNELIWSTYLGSDSFDGLKAVTYDEVADRIYTVGNAQKHGPQTIPIIDPGTPNTYMQTNMNNSVLGDKDGLIQRFCQVGGGKITKVESVLSQDIPVHLFPNPATEEVTISLGTHFKKKMMGSLINVHGSMIKPIYFELSETNLTLTGLPAGVYYVSFLLQGRRYHLPIIKG